MVDHKYVEGVYQFLDALDSLPSELREWDWRVIRARMLVKESPERFVLLARSWNLVEPDDSEVGHHLTAAGLLYLGFWTEPNEPLDPVPIHELDYVSGLCTFLRELELEEKVFDLDEEPAAAKRREAALADLTPGSEEEFWLREPGLPDRKFLDLAFIWDLVDVGLADPNEFDELMRASINQRGCAYLARWSDKFDDSSLPKAIASPGRAEERRLPGVVVDQAIRAALYEHHIDDSDGKIRIKNADNPIRQAEIVDQLVEQTGKPKESVKPVVTTRFTKLFWGSDVKDRKRRDETGYKRYQQMCQSERALFRLLAEWFDLGRALGTLGSREITEDAQPKSLNVSARQGQ